MSTKIKNQLKEVMLMAWTFVKRNGFTMSEAMKCAWANMKLKAAMKQRIGKFYFKKVDGSVREAYGTLKENLIPATSGDNRKRMTQYRFTSILKGKNTDASRKRI